LTDHNCKIPKRQLNRNEKSTLERHLKRNGWSTLLNKHLGHANVNNTIESDFKSSLEDSLKHTNQNSLKLN